MKTRQTRDDLNAREEPPAMVKQSQLLSTNPTDLAIINKKDYHPSGQDEEIQEGLPKASQVNKTRAKGSKWATTKNKDVSSKHLGLMPRKTQSFKAHSSKSRELSVNAASTNTRSIHEVGNTFGPPKYPEALSSILESRKAGLGLEHHMDPLERALLVGEQKDKWKPPDIMLEESEDILHDEKVTSQTQRVEPVSQANRNHSSSS